MMRAAHVRNHVSDPRIALGNAAGDQVQDDGAVLQRGAHGDRESVVVDHRRADAVLDRVVVQHGSAPIHLGIEGLELRLGRGTVEAGARHRDTEHAELVETTFHLAQGGVDVGERQRDEGGQPPRIPGGELSVTIVDEAGRLDRISLPLGIGRTGRRGEHLQLHAGVVHLL